MPKSSVNHISVACLFQGPHNQLEYTIVGDANAIDYFTISDSGLITLKRSPANALIDTFTVSNGSQHFGQCCLPPVAVYQRKDEGDATGSGSK